MIIICISLILFAVISDAINNSIRHWRTNKTNGPYKDFSHLTALYKRLLYLAQAGRFLIFRIIMDCGHIWVC